MIKILYFAQLREWFCNDAETIELTEDIMTLAALRNTLAQRGNRWRMLTERNAILASVNQEVVNDNCALQAGDEVAFFQPVTGG